MVGLVFVGGCRCYIVLLDPTAAMVTISRSLKAYVRKSKQLFIHAAVQIDISISCCVSYHTVMYNTMQYDILFGMETTLLSTISDAVKVTM